MKFAAICLMLHIALFGFAQEEKLLPLSSNTDLYYQYGNTNEIDPSWRYFPFDNLIVKSDTLTLPFVDDFSSNRLRPYKFPRNESTADTVFATGQCLIDNDIEMRASHLSVRPVAWPPTVL